MPFPKDKKKKKTHSKNKCASSASKIYPSEGSASDSEASERSDTDDKEKKSSKRSHKNNHIVSAYNKSKRWGLKPNQTLHFDLDFFFIGDSSL